MTRRRAKFIIVDNVSIVNLATSVRSGNAATTASGQTVISLAPLDHNGGSVLATSVDPTKFVLEFIQCFNENRIDDALEYLSDDVFYHNIPLDPMTGRDAVRAFMEAADLGNSVKTEWDVLAIAAQGETVLTERVDVFYTADGRRDSIPLMGAFCVQDGKITKWRDYFDLAAFQGMSVLVPLDEAQRASSSESTG